MNETYLKRRRTLLKKFGSEEALREHYRNMQQKSAETVKGRPRGYSFKTKEELSEIGKKAARARWSKKDTK